jgi:serine/threonine-protein kinase
VLYEMLAGVPPHEGGSAQQVIMRIIADTPRPVTDLRRSVPPNVAAAVAKALEKLPADRFPSARAFAEALGNPGFTIATRAATTVGADRDARTWQRTAGALGLLSVVLAVLLGRASFAGDAVTDDPRPPVRFQLASEDVTLQSSSTRPFAISPDGRTIVFRAWTDSTTPHLWVRNVGEPRARRLEGTEDGMNAAFSPDGQTLAFLVQNRTLKVIPVAGGAVRRIAMLDAVSAALDWGSDEEILFESIAPAGGIAGVNVNGGGVRLVIPLDSAAGETRQRRPFAIRDAGIIVYGSTARRDEEELVLYRPSDGRRVRPGLPGIGALAMIGDHLIYAGGLGELMAIRLNPRSMEVTGAPVTLTPRVSYGWTGSAVAVSPNGTLVYRAPDASSDARLELWDTSGAVRRLPGSYGVHGTPRFSPNGRQVVAAIGSSGVMGRRMGTASADLWVIDVASGQPTRLTSGAVGVAPSWAASGDRIIFTAGDAGKAVLRSIPVDGSAPPSTLFDFGVFPRYSAMTPDGKSSVVSTSQIANALYRGWLGGTRVDTLVSLAKDGIRAEDPRISPDGRWVAFVERSSDHVWVRSLTGPGLLQVSVKGTESNPVAWGPDSRRLYYMNTEGLHVIELQTTPSLSVKDRRVIRRFAPVTDYDLSPDGRTFIVVNPIRVSSDVIVVVNWIGEARQAWSARPAK